MDEHWRQKWIERLLAVACDTERMLLTDLVDVLGIRGDGTEMDLAVAMLADAGISVHDTICDEWPLVQDISTADMDVITINQLGGMLFDIDPSMWNLASIYVRDMKRVGGTPEALDGGLPHSKRDDSSSISRERLIYGNLHVVIPIAREYANMGVPVLDLIQEGNVALIRSTKDFFVKSREYSFSAYIEWRIRRYMERYIENTARLVRLPVHIEESLKEFRKIELDFGGMPSVSTVSNLTGLSEGKVRKMTVSALPPVYLGKSIRQSDDETFLDYLPDKSSLSPLDIAIIDEQQCVARELMEILPKRDAAIIEKRFGLNSGIEQTYQEIGDEFGLSRERIRQIVSRSLDHMRKRAGYLAGDSIA